MKRAYASTGTTHPIADEDGDSTSLQETREKISKIIETLRSGEPSSTTVAVRKTAPRQDTELQADLDDDEISAWS